MNEAEREAMAFELIDMAGWAISEILDDGSLPKTWKERVKKSFRLKETGAPKKSINQQIGKKVAAHVMFKNAQKHARKDCPYPTPPNSITTLREIADEYELGDESEANKLYKKHKHNCMDDVLKLQKEELRQTIEEKYKEGTDVPPMLKAYLSAMPDKKNIEDKIAAWIKSGKENGILQCKTQKPGLYNLLKLMGSTASPVK